MLRNICLYFAAALLVFVSACHFDKQVDIGLPVYEKQLAVECYLEPGQPMQAFLSKTQGYFDTLSIPFITFGSLTISADGQTESLHFKPLFNLQSHKFFNFTSPTVFVPEVGKTYTLTATDADNNLLTGTATCLPKPKVDTLYSHIRTADSSAYMVLGIQDDSAVQNYYRVIMNRDTLENSATIDRVLTDANFPGQRIPVTSGYSFKQGDSVYVRVYNIEKKYYDFIRSVKAAQGANGNPFSQPGVVKSSVTGGFGIFTCLSYVQYKYIIKQP